MGDYLTLTLSKPHGVVEGAWEESGISSRAGDVFFCLLADWLTLADADENAKNTLHNLGLALFSDYETKQSGTQVVLTTTNNTAIPQDLGAIAEAAQPVETYIIDKAIHLLAKNNDAFFSTPTLLYQSNDSFSHHSPHPHIEIQATAFKKLARRNLTHLKPGQKLMIPLYCLDIDDNWVNPTGSHISSVLVLRTEQAFKIYIFDSLYGSEHNEYKENLINSLIEDNMYREFFYLGAMFQAENDCAIHCYNFFRLCTLASEAMFSEPKGMGLLFYQYVKNVKKLAATLNNDAPAASSLLRIFFVLDCIKSGYQAKEDDMDELQEIYKLFNEGPPDEEAAPVNCFNSCWRRLRRNSYLRLPTWKTADSNER